MNKTPIFIAYYTPGPYAGEAKLLRATLNVLGLDHDIVQVGPKDTWQQATQFKARFIREAMDRHAGRPVVYLDVDCIVIRRPELFWSIDCDVAACIFGGGELLSGTVYLAPGMTRLVDAWIEENARYPVKLPDGREAWDQRTLHRVIKADPSIRFEQLPQSYTWMPELTQRQYPDVDPVILHTRGSYRLNPGHV